MLSLDDTIAAVSTPVGEGGIGIVRLSGPAAPAILRRLFVAGRPADSSTAGLPSSELAPADPRPFHLHYGHIIDPATGRPVDEVLAVHMPAPRTYTRQDVVEIDAHGGHMAVRQVLTLCLANGARLAEPGEFTLRAFLNGRLDLAQAEAVVDVVRARTDRALHTAIGQLAGHLSAQVEPLRTQLLQSLAHLEAAIDFEDETAGAEIDATAVLSQVAAGLERLLAGAGRGLVYRQGVRTAIVGRPNTGKSSLLNRLLHTSRAIVTDIPGTTRDTLEETLNLQGVPIVLVDTAGIAPASADPIERLGIDRSREALAAADLALLVLDVSEPPTAADRDIAALIDTKPALAVLNKVDLLNGDGPWQPGCAGDTRLAAAAYLAADGPWAAIVEGRVAIPVSALTGEGIDALETSIVEAVLSGQAGASDVPLVSNPRHQALLHQALAQVQAAQATCQAALPVDLIAIDLRAAVDSLGEITGQTAGTELLETIFASFCIGK